MNATDHSADILGINPYSRSRTQSPKSVAEEQSSHDEALGALLVPILSTCMAVFLLIVVSIALNYCFKPKQKKSPDVERSNTLHATHSHDRDIDAPPPYPTHMRDAPVEVDSTMGGQSVSPIRTGERGQGIGH